MFGDRDHAHVLGSPREVRHALGYVLRNAHRHRVPLAADAPDPFSSGLWFDGWRDFRLRRRDWPTPPIATARTWLASIGWRRYGLLTLVP